MKKVDCKYHFTQVFNSSRCNTRYEKHFVWSLLFNKNKYKQTDKRNKEDTRAIMSSPALSFFCCSILQMTPFLYHELFLHANKTIVWNWLRQNLQLRFMKAFLKQLPVCVFVSTGENFEQKKPKKWPRDDFCVWYHGLIFILDIICSLMCFIAIYM